jgi:hypothetical protein
MKTYRLIALVAAVLITVFLMRVLDDGKIAASQDQAHAAAAAEAP